MVTGNRQRFTRPRGGDIRIEEWEAVGLAKASVIRTRRLWTAESRDVIRALGVVDSATLEKAKDEIRLILSL